MSLLKSEIADLLSREKGLTLSDSKRIVDAVVDQLAGALVDGERIEIRGFGSFSIREYEAYEGRNPKTGEVIQVAPKKLPFFKCGSGLLKSLNKE